MRVEQALSWPSYPDQEDFGIDRPWRAHVPFELQQSRYTIKTAQTQDEFNQVIQLRTKVFLEEFAGQEQGQKIDWEERDRDADFLIIKDTASQEVLASYRLICSRFSNDFYSLSEFSLGDFLQRSGHKLELSRACVRADKRNSGIFVHLLWRGISEYVQRAEARYLFGCSSIQIFDLKQLLTIYRYLKQEGAWAEDLAVKPLPAYQLLDIESLLRSGKMKEPREASVLNERSLPPLLMAYLKAGAQVYGSPAFDEDFSCLDLFTVLDFDRLSEGHARKYMAIQSAS